MNSRPPSGQSRGDCTLCRHVECAATSVFMPAVIESSRFDSECVPVSGDIGRGTHMYVVDTAHYSHTLMRVADVT